MFEEPQEAWTIEKLQYSFQDSGMVSIALDHIIIGFLVVFILFFFLLIETHQRFHK